MAPWGKQPYATARMGNGDTYYLWIDDNKVADFKPYYMKQYFRNVWAQNSDFLIDASTSSTIYDPIWLNYEEISSIQIGVHPPV